MSSFVFAKFRKTLFVVCVLLIASCIVAITNAATEAELKVDPESKSVPIIEGQTWVNFTFFLEETSNEFGTNVKIMPSDLQDTKRGPIISGDAITVSVDNISARDQFPLKPGLAEVISVSVRTEDIKAGSYQGKIKVDTDNATDVELSLTIQVSKPFTYAAFWDAVGIGIGVVATICGVAVQTQKNRRLEELSDIISKYAKAIVGCFIVLMILYFSSLLALFPTITDFGADGWIDNITAIFFGLGQYGGGSVAATIVKIGQDLRLARTQAQQKGN
jgi:hypothetical protein